MPITSVSSDAAALTLTVIAEYPVSTERLWDAYADPRQLERFWGPEQWPATFTRHDMAVGGHSHYYMTGPDGATSRGWFRFLAVEPCSGFEVEDGFADEAGAPNTEMPTMRMVFSFEPTANGSRSTSVTHFTSVEAMEQLMADGHDGGYEVRGGSDRRRARRPQELCGDRATEAQLLSDTQVRVSRVVRGTVEQVWRAHHDPR